MQYLYIAMWETISASAAARQWSNQQNKEASYITIHNCKCLIFAIFYVNKHKVTMLAFQVSHCSKTQHPCSFTITIPQVIHPQKWSKKAVYDSSEEVFYSNNLTSI